MKIGDLAGLPEKKECEWHPVATSKVNCGNCRDVRTFNAAKSEYDDLILTLDVEEMAQLIFKISYPSHDWNTQGVGINPVKERCRIDAHALSSNAAKVIRISNDRD